MLEGKIGKGPLFLGFNLMNSQCDEKSTPHHIFIYIFSDSSKVDELVLINRLFVRSMQK